jgi:hypothetical protein
LRATRRGAVGGLLGGIAAAGCDGRTRPEATPERTPAGGEPPEDPDAALVDAVVAEVTEVAGVVAGAARAARALGGELEGWRRLHRAHLVALEADGDPGPRRVRGSTPELRDLVRRREAALQRRLADAAVAAHSGSLASLLATMSAAVAQRLSAGSPESR